MTRDREAFLYDICDSARFLLEFTKQENFARYQKDRAFRGAVERELTIIGEAMFQLAKLDPGLVAKVSESQRIIGFRHILVHGYFALKHEVVWGVLKNKLSTLLAEVEALLKAFGFPLNKEEEA